MGKYIDWVDDNALTRAVLQEAYRNGNEATKHLVKFYSTCKDFASRVTVLRTFRKWFEPHYERLERTNKIY